jgi:hypothetical protein
MEPRQTLYPNNGHKPEVGPSADQVMLEGMKVLFDDKVGLYPVNLVAKPAHRDRGAKRKERARHGHAPKRI